MAVTLATGDYWSEIIVVGTDHYPGMQRLVPGPLTAALVREPRNAHDPNAIRVECAGRQVGYLSAYQAAKYAPALDSVGESLVFVDGTCRPTHSGFDAFVMLPAKAEDLRLAVWQQQDVLTRGPRPVVEEKVSLYDKPKHQDALAWCCQGQDAALVGGVLTPEVMTAGKYKGKARLICTVGGYKVGVVPAQKIEVHPEVFAAVQAAGTLPCAVKVIRFENGYGGHAIVAV